MWAAALESTSAGAVVAMSILCHRIVESRACSEKALTHMFRHAATATTLRLFITQGIQAATANEAGVLDSGWAASTRLFFDVPPASSALRSRFVPKDATSQPSSSDELSYAPTASIQCDLSCRKLCYSAMQYCGASRTFFAGLTNKIYKIVNMAGEKRQIPWKQLSASKRWSPDDVWSEETGLSPTWRMFLLGDGSPTRHLRLLTGSKTEVDVLGMLPVGKDSCGAPSEVEQVASPWLLRQVFLRNSRGERLGYAASWWNEEEVKRYLEDTSIPIWLSLAKHKVEIFREICGLCEGTNEWLAKSFGYDGPFFGRHYVFWHNKKPLTLIYEVFSPHLERYLGPVRAPGPSPCLGPASSSAAEAAAIAGSPIPDISLGPAEE